MIPMKTPLQETEQSLYQNMLAVALDEARLGHAEGGIPVGAALFTQDGTLISQIGRAHV